MRTLGALRHLVVILLCSCGGAIDPGGSGTPGEPGALPVPSTPEPPPSYGGTAPSPPSPPSAPSPLPDPTKIGEPQPAGADGTPFHLVVSNRSKPAGTIGVDLSIDGVKVVTGGFVPGVTYTFDFALAEGGHKVEVNAAQSARSLPTTETFAFETTGERWGVVDVSTVRCDPCSTALIGWELLTTAPAK